MKWGWILEDNKPLWIRRCVWLGRGKRKQVKVWKVPLELGRGALWGRLTCSTVASPSYCQTDRFHLPTATLDSDQFFWLTICQKSWISLTGNKEYNFFLPLTSMKKKEKVFKSMVVNVGLRWNAQNKRKREEMRYVTKMLNKTSW